MHTYELHLGPEHGSLGVQVAFINRIINISAARVGSYARVICDSIDTMGITESISKARGLETTGSSDLSTVSLTWQDCYSRNYDGQN